MPKKCSEVVSTRCSENSESTEKKHVNKIWKRVTKTYFNIMSNNFSSSSNVICYLMQGKPVGVKFMLRDGLKIILCTKSKLRRPCSIYCIISVTCIGIKSTPLQLSRIFIQTHSLCVSSNFWKTNFSIHVLLPMTFLTLLTITFLVFFNITKFGSVCHVLKVSLICSCDKVLKVAFVCRWLYCLNGNMNKST